MKGNKLPIYNMNIVFVAVYIKKAAAIKIVSSV